MIKGQYNQSEQENEYEEDVIRGTKVQVSSRGIASLEDSFEAASLCVSVQASYAARTMPALDSLGQLRMT